MMNGLELACNIEFHCLTANSGCWDSSNGRVRNMHCGVIRLWTSILELIHWDLVHRSVTIKWREICIAICFGGPSKCL
jgi:hypothetical protein